MSLYCAPPLKASISLIKQVTNVDSKYETDLESLLREGDSNLCLERQKSGEES